MPDFELREVIDGDLPRFFEDQRDPEGSRLVGYTPRDRDAFDAHWKKIRADPSTLLRTITCGGEVVGNVVSFARDGKREVGYRISRTHWGRGIATQALSAFLRIEGTRPLHARANTTNAAESLVEELRKETTESEGTSRTRGTRARSRVAKPKEAAKASTGRGRSIATKPRSKGRDASQGRPRRTADRPK